MPSFTHFDEAGKAIMADVSEKEPSVRQAKAEGRIKMSAVCYKALQGDTVEKGDVLGVARIAGILAVKQTPALIPLCHTLPIEKAAIDFDFDENNREIRAICTVKATAVTGVEMEALTGVSISLLTIYDMCKSLDKDMALSGIRLLEKTGGKTGG